MFVFFSFLFCLFFFLVFFFFFFFFFNLLLMVFARRRGTFGRVHLVLVRSCCFSPQVWRQAEQVETQGDQLALFRPGKRTSIAYPDWNSRLINPKLTQDKPEACHPKPARINSQLLPIRANSRCYHAGLRITAKLLRSLLLVKLRMLPLHPRNRQPISQPPSQPARQPDSQPASQLPIYIYIPNQTTHQPPAT